VDQIVVHVVKDPLYFMEKEGSILSSQGSAACPSTELNYIVHHYTH